MSITATADYLRVALHTLQTKIAPEMQSSDGHAAAAILGRVLAELARRETVSAPQLAASVAIGRQVEARLAAFAVAQGMTVADQSAAGSGSDFSALAREHCGLMERLAGLSTTLTGERPAMDAKARDELSALLREMASWAEAFPAWQRTAALPEAPQAPSLRGEPLSRELLETFLRSVHPDGDSVTVTQFAPIPGGFGKQTSRATYTDAAGTAHMVIVRKSDPLPMATKGAFRIDNEFALLRDVYRAGVLPVPEPLWLAKDFPGVDADFCVMAPLPGAVPSSFLGAASAQIPEAIILEIAEQMAKLHRIGLEQLDGYIGQHENPALRGETISQCYNRLIGEWQGYFAANDHSPSPFVVYLLDWLACNVPENDARPVLVHGDFNVHNVLVDGGRISGVLDWECANFGAPEQDLAYVRPILSAHIDWDRFIDHYEASGGRRIDRAAMNFYFAFAAMRLCVVFNKGVRFLQQGMNSDIRYGIIDLDLEPDFASQALACTAP